ncbi:DUF3298 and DUF4163 domain-containing protein [Virgibacillus sp. MSP4-1]|uniref:DUF3298 and DUF4163 domain-containing protein n=1 Tax=Virgibacillus sp. MSP4-1 TaxID=2700081 RepID=UPI0003A72B88|nr:DUF3298 and DUF4163 domain-containing protein [Virgibacillus sp. MSP4-1]QHS21713.1 DUF3298 and DUF4163 domain-containing protein [Virgibacillus sp. MSP4-1]
MKVTALTWFIIAIFSFTYIGETSVVVQAEQLHLPDTKASSKAEDLSVKYEEVKETEPEYKINVKIPSIKGMKDDVFQMKFNVGIKAKAEKKIGEFKTEAVQFAKELEQKGQPLRPFQLQVDPALKKKGELISILNEVFVYKGGANGIQKVQTLNILNQKQAKKLSFSDIFKEDADYRKKVNELIKQAINRRREEGEAFFEGEEGFQTITNDQSFYFEDRKLVLVFDEYEIAPGVMGTPAFPISLEDIKDLLKPEIYNAALHS